MDHHEIISPNILLLWKSYLTCGQSHVVAHANHGPHPAPYKAIEDDHQDVRGELDQEELGPMVVDHHVHLVHPEVREAKYVVSILLKKMI